MHIFVEIRKNTHKNKKICLIFKKFRALVNNSGLGAFTSFFPSLFTAFWLCHYAPALFKPAHTTAEQPLLIMYTLQAPFTRPHATVCYIMQHNRQRLNTHANVTCLVLDTHTQQAPYTGIHMYTLKALLTHAHVPLNILICNMPVYTCTPCRPHFSMLK